MELFTTCLVIFNLVFIALVIGFILFIKNVPEDITSDSDIYDKENM